MGSWHPNGDPTSPLTMSEIVQSSDCISYPSTPTCPPLDSHDPPPISFKVEAHQGFPNYSPPPYTPQSSNEGVTILLACPSFSSCAWCLKLYSLIASGMGIIFSSLWLASHVYVLSQTEGYILRTLRF